MTSTEIKLLQAFPEGYKPNDAQTKIFSELADALEQKRKFIIINAPTATGKSFISKTLANYSDDPESDFVKAAHDGSLFNSDSKKDFPQHWGAAILTVTKNLQEQYVQMFPDGNVLKGKNNYRCALNDDYSCEQGICMFDKSGNKKRKCLRTGICPYLKARGDTVSNKCAFYNYSMFNKLSGRAKRKQFLICDEASELESEIVGEFTVTIRMKDLTMMSKYPPVSPNKNDPDSAYLDWIRDINTLAADVIDENTRKAKSGKKITATIIKKLQRANDYFNNTQSLLESWSQTQYLITHQYGEVIFQPLNVDQLADRFFSWGETVILMSATIVDHQSFARTLGIRDYAYIEATTTLDPKKAPIVMLDKVTLNYRNLDTMMPAVCHLIDVICQKHKNKKGIIHTHTMKILDYIKSNCVSRSRFLVRDENQSNEDLLRIHANSSEPTVLVSPSMTHGVDLKGNLGEFQIIVKAPFLPLGDLRVSTKVTKQNDWVWYNNAMLSTIIQMSGRCNRNNDDRAITYIIDGTAVDKLKQLRDKLPKYFLDRVVTSDDWANLRAFFADENESVYCKVLPK